MNAQSVLIRPYPVVPIDGVERHLARLAPRPDFGGLTFSISAQNVLNHVNPAAPVGNLSSPFFGQSLASAGGFGFGPGGVTAGNRRIELLARLSF